MFRRSNRALVQVAVVATALLVCEHRGPSAAQEAPLPSGREVVARHLKAIGGEAAFKAVQSMHARGALTMTAQQIGGDIDVFSARPNRLLIRVTIAGIGKTETGYDGRVGWSLDPVMGPALMTGRQLSEMGDDAIFDSPLYPAAHVKDLTVVGREAFDSRQAYRVKIAFVSGNEQFEFFDVENGLQLGSESRRETPLGVVPTTSVIRDYRPFGDLRLPTTLVQKALGFEQVVKIVSYDFNSVPSETFALPPQIKALIKASARPVR